MRDRTLERLLDDHYSPRRMIQSNLRIERLLDNHHVSPHSKEETLHRSPSQPRDFARRRAPCTANLRKSNRPSYVLGTEEAYFGNPYNEPRGRRLDPSGRTPRHISTTLWIVRMVGIFWISPSTIYENSLKYHTCSHHPLGSAKQFRPKSACKASKGLKGLCGT